MRLKEWVAKKNQSVVAYRCRLGVVSDELLQNYLPHPPFLAQGFIKEYETACLCRYHRALHLAKVP